LLDVGAGGSEFSDKEVIRIPDSGGYRNTQPGSLAQVLLKILAKDRRI